MGVIMGSFNLNMSPKMPRGVLGCVWSCYVTDGHAHDLVTQELKGALLVPGPVF